MLKTTKQFTFTGTSNTDDGKMMASFNANVSTTTGQINIGMNTTDSSLANQNNDVVQADFAEFVKQAYALKDGENNDQTETVKK